MNNKVFGVAAIIVGAAALITATTTAVINFLTLKWTVKVYEPFGRLANKSEPMLNKLVDYSEKWLDDEMNEKPKEEDED